jgi:hypothetical protein
VHPGRVVVVVRGRNGTSGVAKGRCGGQGCNGWIEEGEGEERRRAQTKLPYLFARTHPRLHPHLHTTLPLLRYPAPSPSYVHPFSLRCRSSFSILFFPLCVVRIDSA